MRDQPCALTLDETILVVGVAPHHEIFVEQPPELRRKRNDRARRSRLEGELAKAIRAMEPSIIIPVGYDPGDETALKAFVSAMAATPEEAVSRFSVSRRDISDDTKRLIILEARA